jgi:ubiquinone/menaquinone biosynthesis C-methylase UbiE
MRAKTGARLERQTRLMPPARRLRFELVLELVDGIGVGRPLRVLDAGAGQGLLALTLARRHGDWRIVAADADNEMLDQGRALKASEGLENLDFVAADLTRDLGSEEFDLVLAIECLSEIPDDDAALGAMARALRPGGCLIAHVPQRDWTPVLPGSPRTWRHEVRHGYAAEELVVKLKRAGLAQPAITPTAHSLVWLAQEIADRIKDKSLRVRVAALPLTAGAVRLERWGLTWGPSRAWLAEARRPGSNGARDPRRDAG